MNSMTGFGKSVREAANFRLEVEVKSVNHRFLDIQIRAPRQFSALEQEIRQILKAILQRGRVEVYVTLQEKGDRHKQVILHWELIQELVKEIQAEAQERFGTEVSPAKILEHVLDNEAFIEIQENQSEDNELTSAVLIAVREATLANQGSRKKEGAGIQRFLEDNRQALQVKLDELVTFTAQYEEDYRERFEKKVTEYLGTTVEQDRLLTEVVLLLERSDIHEEIDRMNIHLHSLQDMLQSVNPIGRELDFLIQEMNREVNTIGSKSSPIEIKNIVVQMKTIIEKIREQVQNIE